VRAAGGVIDLALAVTRGDLQGGLAPVRPPGHHATREQAMGFCVFSNVALAARAAIEGGGMSRVAVVDFDVHHGNGTQDILEEDPNVLFISTHQYPHYPGTGSLRETGRGAGAGATLNIPLPAGVGDEGFHQIYERVVLPALRWFQPELILVSAGFDAHWRDPLAGLRLSLAGYAWICEQLVTRAEELCAGRIVLVLEGGYDLEVLAQGMANAARALLGHPAAPDVVGPASGDETGIEDLLQLLERRWE
jgi:acetoin utilization deacetylase AcuC-like enzyme